MLDNFNREITYLRISVIDRCNLRCHYCMPQNGVHLKNHTEILSLEEIITVAKEAVNLGVTKIRLTGGEPLLRRNIVYLVEQLARLPGLKDLAMTTNGTLLAQHAQSLANAGLNRVNISIDTLDCNKFANITGHNLLDDVLAGIDAAIAAQLLPIKLNCVVTELTTEDDLIALQNFADDKNLELRLIPQMDFKNGKFTVIESHGGGDCQNCNRIRLLSNGKILPCLFSDLTFDIKQMGIREALLAAIANKPKCGTACRQQWMVNLGG
jgi:GTP 3',8-cyclase